MKVRLTRKLSERINGVDLSGAREGDTLELPARDALTLLAEGWASPVSDRADREAAEPVADRAEDRPRRAPGARRRTVRVRR